MCYDIFHYGHSNAIRQAKQLGDILVAALHPDEEITQHKGPPVYTYEERLKLLKSIKWVDEIYPSAPYLLGPETLKDAGCDFCAHGDDLPISAETGCDPYAKLKEAGKFKVFKRTHGVSTTDIVDRILSMTTIHHANVNDRAEFDAVANGLEQPSVCSPFTVGTRSLVTSSRIFQFSSGKEPQPGDRIVYTSGVFDILHMGHICFLEKAAAAGDYLIVGVHSDQIVNQCKGSNYPILNLHERVLSLLATRFVSEVVIDVPLVCTGDIMDLFKIDLVVHGKTPIRLPSHGDDPFAEPKRRGKFQIIDSESEITTEVIVNRILKRRLEFEERNRKKNERELKALHSSNKADTGSESQDLSSNGWT
ncbi:ethanolamine-phosphate cytidylyltransferase-like isoform X2 [Tubulanus polymorphus]|uniref:ethanolamine-phosphate cytidylyltransferase-like isoform X2 n=1 Tax=Tubulanus polymorphus TaxID=672921 RepID=UPI003DA575ED